MKRLWIIGAAVLLIAWFGLKDFVYRSLLMANTPASAEPLDYSDVESWAAFPEMRPPGAWETPWGVDVFFVSRPPGVATGPGLVDARGTDHSLMFGERLYRLAAALPGTLPIYAPQYHTPSAVHNAGEYDEQIAIGLLEAFDTYLSDHSRDRAIILAVDEQALPFIAPIVARLTDEDMADRFAGRIVFGANSSGATPENCNPSLKNVCEQTIDTTDQRGTFGFLTPQLPGRVGVRNVVDPDGTAEAIRVQAEQVSAWLDANGAKPAEPLGSIQEVAIVPIRRPGEVVPDQSEED